MDPSRSQHRGTRRGRLRLALLLVVGLAAAGVQAANPCAECHNEQVNAYLATSHRGIATESVRLCVACHGDAAKHLESGEASDIRGPATLAGWTAERQSEACLSCHDTSFPAWAEAPHAGRVSCWSCHGGQALHSGSDGSGLPTAERHATWKLCTTCHQEVKSEFRQEYRHPVEAGLVDCTDCHDIHGTDSGLPGDGRVGDAGTPAGAQACARCHQLQSASHIFEHPAMEEGCTSCHKPHGSWNRGLLASTGNGVCLSCHVQSTFPGVGQIDHEFRLNGGARCWDCHSDVHGSDTTPDLNPRGRR